MANPAPDNRALLFCGAALTAAELRHLHSLQPEVITNWRECCACGTPFRVGTLRPGRGRQLGEHPAHFFAPCGHSITWYGSEPLFLDVVETATGADTFAEQE